MTSDFPEYFHPWHEVEMPLSETLMHFLCMPIVGPQSQLVLKHLNVVARSVSKCQDIRPSHSWLLAIVQEGIHRMQRQLTKMQAPESLPIGTLLIPMRC
jgi:hypothetical protein